MGADGVRDFLNRVLPGLGFAKEANGGIQLLHFMFRGIHEQVVTAWQAVSFPATV